MNKYLRYNLCLLFLVLLIVGAVSAVNILIDPFGIWKLWSKKTVNQYKPEQDTHERLFKAVDIIDLKPSVLFIGTSRTRIGLDPDYYARIQSGTIYNAGLSSANMNEMLWYFIHALKNEPELKQVIVGIDFMEFNAKMPNKPDFQPQQMGKTHLTIKNILATTASLDMLKRSRVTVQQNREHPDLRAYEPNGMRSETILESNWGHVNDLKGYTSINAININGGEYYARYTLSPERMNDFRELVRTCRQRGIDLKVFIAPSHATDMEAIRVSGNWKQFEDMKRQLCAITPVWDFSGYNSITTEPIGPGRKCFWESTHFKKEIGNLILNRLNHVRDNGPADFGVRITPENVEQQLQATRKARAVWAEHNPGVAAFVRSLKKE
ncbi:MAG: hypothetical protein ACM3QZ_12940 [Solirubrobacterales bacterium]